MIIISSVGKFHFLKLAEELNKKQSLSVFFSGYPKFRLKSDFINKKIINKSFFQTSFMVLNKFIKFKYLKKFNHFCHCDFDLFVSKQLENIDFNTFYGHSSSSLISGIKAKNLGKNFFCERSSCHIEFDIDEIKEEYKKFNVTWDGNYKKIVERENKEYEIADKIIVPSSFAKSTFLNKGINEKKIIVNNFGTNFKTLDRFIERDISQTLNIIFVGICSIEKGIFYLLEAMKSIKNKNINLKLVGRVDKQIEDFLKKYKKDNRISFLGSKSNSEVKNLLLESDILVLPSLREGMSLTIGEAIACGCTIIATHNSGAGDVIEENKEGFLVNAKDSNIIAEKINFFYENRVKLNEMRYKSFLRSKKIEGFSKYADKIIKLSR